MVNASKAKVQVKDESELRDKILLGLAESIKYSME